MTRVTKNRGYPYPLKADDSAGALDIERLARAVDRDLAALDLSWQTDLQRPSATWTDSRNNIPNGADFEISSFGSGVWSEKVGAFDATWQKIPAYWLVSVDIGLTCVGALSAGSTRLTKIQVNESQVGPFALLREQYETQDAQADGTVWMSTEFATLVDRNTTIAYVVNHANAASQVNGTVRSSVSLLVFA